MAVAKDPERDTWTVQCWYRDWQGARRKKTKRGFKSRASTLAWERDFAARSAGAIDMRFGVFFDVYTEDDALVLIDCEVSENAGEGITEEAPDRKAFERIAAAYLAEVDLSNTEVRYDTWACSSSERAERSSATTSTRSHRWDRTSPQGLTARSLAAPGSPPCARYNEMLAPRG